MTLLASEFDIKTQDENAQSLADVCPDGEFWRTKNIDESNFRKLLLGCATEIGRGQSYIQSLADHYIPNLNDSFINDWENILGIPDSCFTKDGIENGNTTSDSARRRDIIVKLSKMNLQTAQDYIDLAAEFGLQIQIVNSGTIGPTTYNQFHWLIIFTGIAIEGWTYDWDIEWGNPFVSLIECIFNKQRPAHTLLDFAFSGT